MDNSKLVNRNTMNKTTRTIGINTDMNLINVKCSKCLQDSTKLPFLPYYIPLPYPVCNCMVYNHFQNNILDFCNVANSCSSHQCLKSCSSSTSSSSCKHCGSKISCNDINHIYHTSSGESVNNMEEKNEDKLNVSIGSSRNDFKEQDEENVYQKSTAGSCTYSNVDEISNSENITKYADEFLEKNYKPKYGSKTKIKNETDEEEIETENRNDNNNEKQLLNHLLTPNTTRTINNRKTIIENDDSDDCIDSENDENISEEDDFSGETVIMASKIDVPKHVNHDDRRPTRINISQHNSSKNIQEQTKNTDVEMLMMIKALVNNQYNKNNNNSPRLNKLLNHIGAEKAEQKFKSLSPRKRIISKNYTSIIPKLNENKKSS